LWRFPDNQISPNIIPMRVNVGANLVGANIRSQLQGGAPQDITQVMISLTQVLNL
jgi:hypothetical protein